MTIDLEKEIVRENTATLLQEQKHLDEQAKLDNEIAKVQGKIADAYKAGIMDELGFDYQLAEARRIRSERDQFAKLPQNRIMSTDAIRKVCIKFGLRFLPTRFYKGALDVGIGPAVESVKAALGGSFPVVDSVEQLDNYTGTIPAGIAKVQFSIAAPSEAFALQPRPVDPLMFLRLGSLKWFLIHKWGDDLKTGDVRKGEINESNWNSQFSDRTRGNFTSLSMGDYMRMMGSNQPGQSFSGTTVSSRQWVTTGSTADSSGISWAQSAFNSTAASMATTYGR